MSELPNRKTVRLQDIGYNEAGAYFVTMKLNFPTDMTIWQSRYYEHVVRGRYDYREIAEYIENNPARWEMDKLK